MPSSRPSTIPYVISVIKQVRPSSILDVGVGFGKWGYLFREYTDIIQSELEPQRYSRTGWKVRIEGIEAFEPYLHDGHRFVYDKIHVGDAAAILPSLGKYDVIFLGDIIEHFKKEDGEELLQEAIAHANRCVLLTTPKYETGQGELLGNPLERHQSLWTKKDFRRIGKCMVALADRDTYVVAYPIGHKNVFRLEPERFRRRGLRAALRAILRRGKRTLQRIVSR